MIAITKYHGLGGLNSKFSHDSGGYNYEIKVSAELISSLLDL